MAKKKKDKFGFTTYTGEELGFNERYKDVKIHFKGMPQFNDKKPKKVKNNFNNQ